MDGIKPKNINKTTNSRLRQNERKLYYQIAIYKSLRQFKFSKKSKPC